MKGGREGCVVPSPGLRVVIGEFDVENIEGHEVHKSKGWFPPWRNFYVRTCVKFTFANKIEAMYERSHVSLKVANSLNFTFNLNTLYLASILFTWLKFTVNVRSQKREINLYLFPSSRASYLYSENSKRPGA